jgi:hypothetical protein
MLNSSAEGDIVISYCGLDCDQCEAFIATQNNDDTLRVRVAKEWAKLSNAPIRPEHINCTGCRSAGVKTYFCDQLCEIRKCATTRTVSTCAECSDFPCSVLDQFFATTPQAKTTLDALSKQ